MTTGSTHPNDDPPGIPADVRDASAFFHRRRPLFWAALAWMAGIVLDDRLASNALLEIGAPLFVSLLACVGLIALIGFRTPRRKLFVLCLMATLAGCVAHGFLARVLPTNHISSRTPTRDTDVRLEGVIQQVSRTQYGGARWVLDCEKLLEAEQSNVATQDVCGLVQLYVSNPPSGALEGSRVRLWARVGAPRDTFPDDFDVVAYLNRNGIYRSGSVIAKSSIETNLPRAWSPLLWMRSGSHALSTRVDELLPPLQLEGRSAESQSALLSALLFGRREQIDRHDRDAFAATGTAHLLAISGLQIQFLALLFWNVLKRCGISRRTNSILLFAATWAYTALSGAEPPIVRAAVMISLLLFSHWVWREADGLSLLGAAAIVILTFDPAQLFQAGFQLSFAAVFALIVLVPLFNDALHRNADMTLVPLDPSSTRGFRERLADLALVSFAAWLGTAPIIAWHMGQFSLVSVPANLVAVPLSGIAMVCGLIGLLLGAVSATLAAPFAWAAFALLALLQTLTDLAASVPVSTLRVATPPILVLFLYTAVILAVWIKRSSFRLRLLATCACVTLIASMAFGALGRSVPTSPRITMLNAGRGHAIVVQNGEDAVLIDAGPPYAGARIRSYLESHGIRRLRAVVILENERGAVGGLREVLERIPIDRVILPRIGAPEPLRRELESILRARNIPYGESLDTMPRDVLSGFAIELADDAPTDAERVNETSLSIRISCGEASLLILSTRSAASLDRLSKRASASFLQSSLVVLTGHYSGHWPRNTQALLDRCEPGYLISLGHDSHDPPKFGSCVVHELQHGSLLLLPRDKLWRVASFSGAWSNPE